ncbi:MAG TPA: hypothetical protein VGB53_11385, partial [Rubricoccaceae bacterium]
ALGIHHLAQRIPTFISRQNPLNNINMYHFNKVEDEIGFVMETSGTNIAEDATSYAIELFGSDISDNGDGGVWLEIWIDSGRILIFPALDMSKVDNMCIQITDLDIIDRLDMSYEDESLPQFEELYNELSDAIVPIIERNFTYCALYNADS